MEIQGFDFASQTASLTSLSQTEVDEARRAAEEGRDEEAAKSFESVFARLLVREMRRALPEGLFGGGSGADVYEGWFDEHLGEALVERDALGLAGMIKTAVGKAATAQNEQGDAR